MRSLTKLLPLLLSLGVWAPSAGAEPSAFPGGNGLIAFTTSNISDNSEICVMDPDGRHRVALTETLEEERDVAWSPDGTELAFGRRTDSNAEIVRMEVSTGDESHLVAGAGFVGSPEWSPDQAKIAYAGRQSSQAGGLFTISLDNGVVEQLTFDVYDYHPAWSPDGTEIAFVNDLRDGRWDDGGVWVVPSAGGDARYVGHGHNVDYAPDGTAFAVTNLFSGGVYVYGQDGSNASTISERFRTDNPSWSPDGGKIAFSSWEGGFGLPDQPPGVYVVDTMDHSEQGIYAREVSSIDWQTEPAEGFDLPDGLLPCRKIVHERGISFKVDRDGSFDGRVRIPDGFDSCMPVEIRIERRTRSGWEFSAWARPAEDGRYNGNLAGGTYRAVIAAGAVERPTGRIDRCTKAESKRRSI